MKKFAVFDIDGTIYRYALYHKLVETLATNGSMPAGAADEYEQELANWKNRTHSESFRAFALAQVKLFEKYLPSLSIEQIEAAATSVIATSKEHTYTYTRDLIKQLRAEGYFLIAISGSMSEVAHPFAREYGFDDWSSTEYHTENGVYTGKATERHHKKHITLQKMIEKHGLSMSDSIAIGDSAGDISMLAMVEQPIAFNPEKKLFEAAKENGWKIVLERKNMIYELTADDGHYVLA